VHTLLGVFVAAVVAEPDVISSLYQFKGQTSLSLGEAHPHLAVHHQPVVHVDDLFLDPAISAAVDPDVLLSSSPPQAMKAKQIAITRLHNVLLAVVPVEFTKLCEVACVRNCTRYTLLLLARALRGRR
jgi:hypothetical protein